MMKRLTCPATGTNIYEALLRESLKALVALGIPDDLVALLQHEHDAKKGNSIWVGGSKEKALQDG